MHIVCVQCGDMWYMEYNCLSIISVHCIAVQYVCAFLSVCGMYLVLLCVLSGIHVLCCMYLTCVTFLVFV